MRSKAIFILIIVFAAGVLFLLVKPRMNAQGPAAPVVARVNGYGITLDEFQEGFSASAFASRDDNLQARREYLESLIDQKLILLDAQKRNIDKARDFLRSVEKFWTQSLLTTALGQKTMELRRGASVRDEDIRRIYENMIREGVTDKPYNEVYPQIKWQAERQLEVQLLSGWVRSLRKDANISIDSDVLKMSK